MKKVFFSCSIYFLLTLSNEAQQLTQIKPDCNSQIHVSNDLSPSPQPIIYDATINLLPTNLVLVKPQYTEEAREAGIYGNILASVVFQADGKVTQTRILQGLPNGLNDQVILAAKQIKFSPAIKDEVPVSVRMKLEFSFALSELDSKQITKILEQECWFLSPQTIQTLANDFAKRKLAIANIKKSLINNEQQGINQLPPEEKQELLLLQEEGAINLCNEQQKVYLERLKQTSGLADIELIESVQIVLSGELLQLFRFRQTGIKTLPIEKQKRFVELYNRAVLLGHNLQSK
jgi:TonB family protein